MAQAPSASTWADANTKLQLSHSTAELCGLALGGFLVKALAAPVAMLVDAASFVVSALLVLGASPRATDASASDSENEGPLRDQVREGLSYAQ